MLSADELERYARHIVLREVGGPGQAALKEASVLVIGAGGLGAPALMYLAAAGVGTLGVVDDDVVSLSNLQRQIIHATPDIGRRKVDTAASRIYVYWGGAKGVAESARTILATPPGFRPIHFEEAVNQGKQIFMEKPVATDPAGIQRVLAAAAIAKQKKLNVVVGLQRRYQNSYRELIKRVHDGAIGEIVGAQAWWNNDGVWVHPRQTGWTEMEYQMRNWYYFVWLCGDHITEQHIHNLDVINWAMDGYPVKAQGMGGREVRKGKDYGQIFDHHYVEFHYGDGTVLNSQCRHQKGTMSKVDELLIGTKGMLLCDAARITDNKGRLIYQFDKSKENQPYQTEHDELFAAIAKGEYKFWDAERGAKSSMTSILGRMATYSGQAVEWDKAINSGINIMPSAYDFSAAPPVLPDAEGNYPVAVPGVTKFF